MEDAQVATADAKVRMATSVERQEYTSGLKLQLECLVYMTDFTPLQMQTERARLWKALQDSVRPPLPPSHKRSSYVTPSSVSDVKRSRGSSDVSDASSVCHAESDDDFSGTVTDMAIDLDLDK
jgi:hypothetical protein